MDRANPTTRMGRREFRRWIEEQGKGRFERIDGEPVAMAPERLGHTRLKYRIWQAVDAALAAGGLDCEAIGDGATVEVNDATDCEPEVLVECGPRSPNDTLAASRPAIVMEVVSRSTRGLDTGAKLAGYFSVPTVMHCVLWHIDRRLVIHHRRDGPEYRTRILHGGVLDLDPPAIAVDIDAVYRKAGV